MSSNDHRLVRCNKKDEETLLIIKKGINDSTSHGKISTWLTEKDCCAWEGVHCDKITGRVTELHLSDQNLEGEINFSILQLEFLGYLDLSYNDFDVINISATQHNITHTSNLFYLDLSFGTLHMDNLDWLSPFSSFKYLNLSGIDLHKETNWLKAVNTLPPLLELQLGKCNLSNFIINPSIEYSNLSSLVILDLSYNNFTYKLPNWFFNLTKELIYLDISWTSISGEIPSSLLNLKKLRMLDLPGNHLQGSVLDEIGQLANIQYLDLFDNLLSGSNIPSIVANLSSLEYLNIADNNFSGGLPNISSMVITIDLAYNAFSGSIPHCWKNLKDLQYVNLWNNKLSGTQLQSFDASSYIGNPKLCGAPLNNCSTEEDNPKTATTSPENEDGDSIRESLYLGMGVGFAAGFWGICGSLFLIRKWRHAFYRFVDGVGDKLNVTLMVIMHVADPEMLCRLQSYCDVNIEEFYDMRMRSYVTVCCCEDDVAAKFNHEDLKYHDINNTALLDDAMRSNLTSRHLSNKKKTQRRQKREDIHICG
ncbi:hypothetical protein TSUD_131150 [Trifolium subterraneum]|uniref:Leucine-rich repeat-containing N-terminal plant-type domain-containing protein n=1 Tax=Trifolium subterraneum TaxID=3900 RepID=A0A2Z6PFA2_TRISU|nr:hypothetical protein TSUD_131150 [Trifolium subterraneum]